MTFLVVSILMCMKKTSVILLTVTGLAGCGLLERDPPKPTIPLPAPAAFAELKNCMLCHQKDDYWKAPSWKEIAQKYSKDPNAESAVTQIVLEGGVGQFGEKRMPSQKLLITTDEAHYLVKWILKGAPDDQ